MIPLDLHIVVLTVLVHSTVLDLIQHFSHWNKLSPHLVNDFGECSDSFISVFIAVRFVKALLWQEQVLSVQYFFVFTAAIHLKLIVQVGFFKRDIVKSCG